MNYHTMGGNPRSRQSNSSHNLSAMAIKSSSYSNSGGYSAARHLIPTNNSVGRPPAAGVVPTTIPNTSIPIATPSDISAPLELVQSSGSSVSGTITSNNQHC